MFPLKVAEVLSAIEVTVLIATRAVPTLSWNNKEFLKVTETLSVYKAP